MSSPHKPFTHRITLLRHGESKGNAKGIFQGHADFDLTEKGRSQTKALAARWHQEGQTFKIVISSPLARARQTAKIITEMLSISLEFDDDWKEIDNGKLAGLHVDDAEKRHPFPDFMNIYEPIGGSGESSWDLYLRAGRAVRKLVNLPAGDYLIVSHGGFLNRVLYVMLGIFPQANFVGARFHFRNTSFAKVFYNPERHIWLLERLNDHAHLPEQSHQQVKPSLPKPEP
jgi:broad specificity phosphatase PhoE